MVRFTESECEIPGVYYIERTPSGDDRGFLERWFCINELYCWNKRNLMQVNRTFTSQKGTIRGLHFQFPPFSEAKYISCLRGTVFDVAVDLRKTSPSFGRFISIQLDAKKYNGLIIPEGVAHGFQTLTDNVEMLYFHSERHNMLYESGLNPFDETLNINWPLSCSKVSVKDLKSNALSDFKGIVL